MSRDKTKNPKLPPKSNASSTNKPATTSSTTAIQFNHEANHHSKQPHHAIDVQSPGSGSRLYDGLSVRLHAVLRRSVFCVQVIWLLVLATGVFG